MKILLDDHTGNPIDFEVLGVWKREKDGKLALAINGPHSLNGVYIGDDNNVHLSTMSVAGVVYENDIRNGIYEDLTGKWVLVKTDVEGIYELLENKVA